MLQLDQNFASVPAETGNYERPPSNGYIFRIVKSEIKKSSKGENQLLLSLDIAEGPYKGAFEKYPRLFYQGMQGKQTGRFKGILGSIKESNPAGSMNGVITKDFLFDERPLNGKLVGGSLREEEYKKHGETEIKSNMKVSFLCSINSVKNGEIKPQPIKKWSDQKQPDNGDFLPYQAGVNLSEQSDLPF